MKITKLLILIILIPICIGITIACYFQFKRYQIMTNYIQVNIGEKKTHLESNLEEILINTKRYAEILSRNKHIIKALKEKNISQLNEEAHDFTTRFEEVYFATPNHQVFASNAKQVLYQSVIPFNERCDNAQIVKLNNTINISNCQKIITSENQVLGYVIVMNPINVDFLKILARDVMIEAELRFDGTILTTLGNQSSNKEFEKFEFPFTVGPETMFVTLLENNNFTLDSIYRNFIIMIFSTLFLGLALVIAIPYFMNKYINIPLLLVEKKISLFYKNEIVNETDQIPDSEIKNFYNAIHRLQVSVAEKEKLLSEKSEFLEKDNLLLRVISHDVSNTLTVIQASLLRLKRDDQITSERKIELMEKIFATIKIATGVLHHVKEIKALEAGKMCLILEPTTIQEVFGVAQTIFEDRLIAKDVKISLEDLSNGETFLCHKSSFSNSVFNNFISNAIKFSPRGTEIKIKAYLENDIYRITISDQGIGIPEEIANNLFDIGKATSRTGTDGESGTGFGMNLAKTYMEQYKAELRFSTQITGKTGTTFELLLQKAS
jgi:signal transduction histidine kinase